MDQTNPIPKEDSDTQATSTTQQNVTHSKSNKLFLPKQTLQGYGCVNCIWKSYGQCPKGFTKPEESVPEGYCEELAVFILALAEPGDSISAVKEKFFLYTQEMQAMADGSEFKRIFQEYKEFKSNSEQHIRELGYEGYRQKLGELEASMTTFKIWWSRLTDSIVKGMSRIADRESRRKEAKGDKKITIQQLNVLLKESDKTLKELE